MPENNDIIISISNLVTVMDPSYTVDKIVIQTNIFANFQKVDAQEVANLFKIVIKTCDISE